MHSILGGYTSLTTTYVMRLREWVCVCVRLGRSIGRRRRELRLREKPLRRVSYVRAAILALQARAFVRYHLLAPRSQHIADLIYHHLSYHLIQTSL